MVLSINRKLAEIGALVDSAVAGDFLTVNDSGSGIFRDVQWTEIAGRPDVLDSAQVKNLVDSGFNALADGAPAAMDTLNEIAAAINNDANYYDTVTGLINAAPDSAQVSGIITADVDTAFVDALNVNADTLNSQQGSYYLDYSNFTNTPAITDSTGVVTTITQSYVNSLGVNAFTLDGQQGSYYLDYSNFTNTPNILDSANVTSLADTAIASTVASAPAALDTLNEIAAALNDDANLASTITNLIAAAVDSTETSSIISADVDKAFIDALSINADNLDGQDSSYYLDYTNFTNTPNVLDSADVLAIADSARVTGVIDSAYTQALIDSAYVASKVTANSGFASYTYIATQGQTTFDSTDYNSQTLAYDNAGILVFYNGVLLINGTDYTATDGTSVVLTTAADSGDNLVINKWALPSSSGSSSGFMLSSATRALFGGFYTGSTIYSEIDYFTIATTGNYTSFGDLTLDRYAGTAASDGTYGFWAGGHDGSNAKNTIDYVTIGTTGNATDFGDLNSTRTMNAACADATYGLIIGGAQYNSGNGPADDIEYITIATPGNATNFMTISANRKFLSSTSDGSRALVIGGDVSDIQVNIIEYWDFGSFSGQTITDFGDLSIAAARGAAICDGTYGIHALGFASNSSLQETIEYVTVQTPANSSDFGDLTVARYQLGGAANGTRGLFAGGYRSGSGTYNIVDYVTTATPGNATDFGDLIRQYSYATAGCSGS